MSEVAVSFTIPGSPQGKGRPRAASVGGKARMFTPAKTVRYESLVSLFASQAMAGRLPMAGPVELCVLMVLQVPASWSKTKRAAALAGDVLPTVKPDFDNAAKAVADACNGIVFDDDKQVVDALVRKRYGEPPRVEVTAREILHD